MRSLALALLATFTALTAVAQNDPLRAAPQDKAFAKLRGITQFYIDVTTSENRPEDADLRTEIRDGMELELRRANLTPKAVEGLSPEAATPLLLVEVRYDRGLGRYTADVILSVRDNATITRNKEAVLAQSYSESRRALGTSDTALNREVKARSRELVLEIIDGMKRLK
ncbi:MAG: hypothetical protein NWQ74_03880 [Opitutales bacterium]|jgi:hypothetical protein|nr:hypothetical protein [Opitutales bacterium]MDP4658776.1 hypothetical protein [Opitutales bacterium]MDP4774588.1 hypothetical protein [Opitutales bacterium]MDP4787663.1 hypothetical protein [Opitutales bacterium]MDP4860858.1 hypothetical protein [Opitutales bacterium]